VLYSFADIASDGSVISSDTYADLQKHYATDSWNDQGNNAYGCIKQLYLLKKQNRSMKVLLSIGGWTYSPKFAPIAATAAGRQKFASTAVTLVKDWGFDGIDIDWEYPASPTEATNFVLLLQACRQALDQYAAQYAPGYHFVISVASPAGPQNYKYMDFAGMDQYVDMWNLMAYDYAGSWDSTSGHQANIYPNPSNPVATKFNTEQAVSDYLTKGIASSKVIMGLPLYGRSFEATTGLGQPYSGVGSGSVQAGVWLYRDLPRSGATELYDNVAKASYSYDSASQELISYDNVGSAVTKAAYLKGRGLGGALFWEASGDKTGEQSLVGTLANQMGALDSTPNLLSYPASQYDNIRAGVPS
jgi:chitinase